MIDRVKESFAAMIAGAGKAVTVKHRTDAETLRDHCQNAHGVEPAIRKLDDGRFTVGREEVLDGVG